MLLYQSNCITETEMRKELGRQALSEEDRNDLYAALVTEAAAQNNFERTLELTKISAQEKAKSSGSSSSKTNSKGNKKTQKGQGAKKAAQQKVTPKTNMVKEWSGFYSKTNPPF